MIDDSLMTKDYERIDFHLLTYPTCAENRKCPLILILHGSGVDSKSYLQDWREEAVKHHYMILAPAIPSDKTPRPDDWKSLIDHIVQNYPVDPGRICLAGASRGAFWARTMLGLYPRRWRGAIFIAGPGDLGWWQNANPEKYPPILFVHGEQDNLTAIFQIRKLTTFLRDKGFAAALISYPDAGHTHDPKWNEAIFEWMGKVEGENDAGGGRDEFRGMSHE